MIDKDSLLKTDVRLPNLVKIAIIMMGLVVFNPLATAADIALAPSDPVDVAWAQANAQSTLIWQDKPAFSAAYSGANSLSPNAEQGYSLSGTAYLGARVWRHTEIYLNPETISTRALSNGLGLGGLTNGENQKGSFEQPQFYLARAFIRQSWNLGGETTHIDADQNQLAYIVDKRRIVLTAGKYAVTDIFDTNALAGDPRTQFMNWSFIADGAYDYAAEAKGYSVGVALEFYMDDWVVRMGRFEQPAESNGATLDPRIFRHYGDQLEIEHDHIIFGQTGLVKILVFHDRSNMGSFQDALNLWQTQDEVGVPSVAAVRRNQTKTGYALNMTQNLTPNTGVFFRLSKNDGVQETYAFAEIEQQLSAGIVAHGTNWGRPDDTVGLAYASNGLSKSHQAYLKAGGLGAFLGDGTLNYAHENVFETYYSRLLTRIATVSVDYQRIFHPGYNADRGPVNVFSTRLHIGF